MVIYVASYPRSGNTFFRILLNRVLGVKTYGVERLFDKLGITDVIGHEPLPDTIQNLNLRPELFFVKTHDLPTDDLPAIYLMRDGRDAVASFARYICSFSADRYERWFAQNGSLRARLAKMSGRDPFKRRLKKVITGSYYGGWSRNVLSWTRDREGPTTLIRFEDLITDPCGSLERGLSSLSIETHEHRSSRIPTFEELNRIAPEFFRQGRSGSWRNEFTPRLYDLFWSIHGEAMDFHGYSRDSGGPPSVFN